MADQNKTRVIFDLDGTLALIDHRRPLLEDKSRNSNARWRAFFAACVDDEPNLPVIESLNALSAQGYLIYIFSGRSDEVKQQTIEWLAKHNINYDLLRMRDAGDHSPDEELKRGWIEETNLETVLCIFDDRDKVVAMWRNLGLTCFQVAQGAF